MLVQLLKKMAMQQLMNKMSGNSLGAAETQNAAEAGANGLMQTLTGALGGGGGGLAQLQDLLTNNENSTESNGLFEGVRSKIQESLQAQGMSEEEAATEAASTAPDVINGLKEKFASEAEEDKGFDLSALASLAGGAGGLNAGSILNAAKNILGK